MGAISARLKGIQCGGGDGIIPPKSPALFDEITGHYLHQNDSCRRLYIQRYGLSETHPLRPVSLLNSIQQVESEYNF